MIKAIWLKVSFLGLAVFALAASSASAWQVTVYNQGSYQARVNVLVNKAFYCSVHSTADIPPKGSHVFETGAWCPAMATGVIYDESGNQITVSEMNCFSGDWGVGKDTTGCGNCCYNVRFTLCSGVNGLGKTYGHLKAGLIDCSNY